MRVALTWHRPQRLGLPEDVCDIVWDILETWLMKELVELHKESDELVGYCGMASGCDILFGYILSAVKDVESNIKLSCVLPCKNYNSSNKYYQEIKETADEWIELSDKFYKGCDNVRDQYMIDHCDVLIAIWDDNKSGGVWSTIRKLKRQERKLFTVQKKFSTMIKSIVFKKGK